jgi:hypothetical protein
MPSPERITTTEGGTYRIGLLYGVYRENIKFWDEFMFVATLQGIDTVLLVQGHQAIESPVRSYLMGDKAPRQFVADEGLQISVWIEKGDQ